MTSLTPRCFDKYVLLDKLDEGGMAELYRAVSVGNEGFQRLIAIKMIQPHLADKEELVKSFIDEAKLAARLHHQNIVQIHHLASHGRKHFIAMEYLPGKDLGKIAREGKRKNRPLPLEYALFIVSRVCAGLDYAHRLRDAQGLPLNIVHCDISPQNILVTYEGDVKVVDFGIARAASVTVPADSSILKGKIAYMSPEQAGGSAIDHRSDIFSTGIILYELITGKQIFDGNTSEVLSRAKVADFEPLENLMSDLPVELYEILRRALAKDPNERYQSAGHMLSALEECMGRYDMRPSSRSLGQYMRTLFSEEIAMEEEMEGEMAEVDFTRFSKRRSWTWYGFSAGLVAALLVLSTFAVKQIIVAGPGVLDGCMAVYEEGLFAEAIHCFENALKREPALIHDIAVPYTQCLHSEVRRLAGAEPEQAKALLMKLLEIESEDAKTYLLLGRVNSRLKEYDEVFEALLKVLELHPVLFTAEVAAPYAEDRQGLLMDLIPHYPEYVKSLLLRAKALDSQNIEILLALGRLYIDKKEYSSAIAVYQEISALNPQVAKAFFNLGSIYCRDEIKNFSKAEQMFQKAVMLKPPYLDDALYMLGWTQAQQGKEEQAMKNVKRALAINSKHELAKQLLATLLASQTNKATKTQDPGARITC